MNKGLIYDDAINELELLIDEIEDENIKIDTLAEKTKRANELIKFCESALKTIENKVKNE